MNCEICRRGQRQTLRDRLQSKYFEAFNFYFAKPINEIIAQVPHAPHVIKLKDYVILDEQVEFLKRFYVRDEIAPRIEILTEFYTKNYKLLHPNVLVTEAHQIMAKRYNKYDKLFYHRAEQRSEQQPVTITRQMLKSSTISFETQEHDIYEDNTYQQQIPQLDLGGLQIVRALRPFHQDEELDLNSKLDECVAIINKNPKKIKHQEPKKTKRLQNDSSAISLMLKEYQKMKQLRNAVSSDGTTIQGYQGQQKSQRQEHNNNNGSQHSCNTTKQENLKKIYQQLPKKTIDMIAKGAMTDRASKRPPPIDLLINDLKVLNTAESKSKVEFKYMIPSQYNAQPIAKLNKAKSTSSKKIVNELGAKSQHVPRKTDEIVKKCMELATQNIKRKFDFKLNLQGLNEEEEIVVKKNNYFTERHSQAIDKEQFNSHRKILK